MSKENNIMKTDCSSNSRFSGLQHLQNQSVKRLSKSSPKIEFLNSGVKHFFAIKLIKTSHLHRQRKDKN